MTSRLARCFRHQPRPVNAANTQNPNRHIVPESGTQWGSNRLRMLRKQVNSLREDRRSRSGDHTLRLKPEAN